MSRISQRFRSRCLNATCLAVAFSAILTSNPVSAEATKSDGSKSEETSKTEEPKPIKLTGVFVANQSTELTTGADELGSLKIERLVAHGKRVAKGENVVWLETEEADKKIHDAEVELKLAELGLQDAEFEFKQFLETQKLDRKQIERIRKRAQQAFDNFQKVDRQRQIDQAKFSLVTAEAYLENATEELEQLQQMYEEDDLTEESEEIVLKRARQAVESAEFRLEGVKTQTKRVIEQSIPRQTAEQEDAIEKARLTYQSAVAKQQSERRKKEIELSKQREKTKEQTEDLKTLRDQRKRVVLTAPHDGFVIHGALTSGKISEKPSQLKVGSSVTSTQVVATIVNPNSLHVLATVPEADLAHLALSDEVIVVPAVDKEDQIKGKIKSISSLPTVGTKFQAIVSIPRTKNALIQPTTTCSVEIEPCEEAESPSDQSKPEQEQEAKKKDGKKKPSENRKRGSEKGKEAKS